MREIKFRAWDKKNKKWHNSWGNLFPWGTYPKNKEIIILDVIPSHFKFYQFTGLKDKNDKEIYEGDIIKWLSTESKNPVKEVFYNEDIASFCMGTKANFLSIQSVFESGFYQPISGRLPKPGEGLLVIGNIHENPELITQADQ